MWRDAQESRPHSAIIRSVPHLICHLVWFCVYGSGEELPTPTEIVTHAHDVAPGSGEPEKEKDAGDHHHLRMGRSDPWRSSESRASMISKNGVKFIQNNLGRRFSAIPRSTHRFVASELGLYRTLVARQ